MPFYLLYMYPFIHKSYIILGVIRGVSIYISILFYYLFIFLHILHILLKVLFTQRAYFTIQRTHLTTIKIKSHPKIPYRIKKKPSLISNFLSCVINNQKHFILHSWMAYSTITVLYIGMLRENSRSFMVVYT